MSPVLRRAALALLAVPVLALLPVGGASAAPTTISIRAAAFAPSSVTLILGSSVQYKNDTGVAVLLRSTSTNWSFTEPLGIGATSSAHKPAVPGTFTAGATGPGVSSSGTVRIVKPVATSTPTHTVTPRPSSPPSSPPSSSPAPRQSSATAQPSTGVASGPPIVPGGSPGPTTPESGNPAPSLAPPPTDPPVLAGGSKSTLIQHVGVRRLGLPGALGAVLALGLLFGLARVLLSIAPPTERRAG